MRSRVSRMILLGFLGVVGCQSPPDISAELEAHVDALNAVNLRRCECPQLLGYGTVSECSDALGLVGNAEYDCFAAALEGHEEDGQEYLGCVNAVLEDFEVCLSGNAGCEADVDDQCTQTRDTAMAACSQLDTATRATFDACSP